MSTNDADVARRLARFQVPPQSPVPDTPFLVARLKGLDFDGIFESGDFPFGDAFDPAFGKAMVRTAGHLLGDESGAAYAYVEQTEFSLLISAPKVRREWRDAGDLKAYFAGVASAQLSLAVDGEAVFLARLYALAAADVAVAYFSWRQQEVYLAALDGHCRQVMPASARRLLAGMGPHEKEEVLRQHDIEYTELPLWQRHGCGVRLAEGGGVLVDTALPHGEEYEAYVRAGVEMMAESQAT